MMRTLWTALAFALVLPTMPAKALGQMTIKTLYSYCATTAREQDRSFCLGYINGAAAVMFSNGEHREDINLHSAVNLACNPGRTITCAAMVQAFRNWVVKYTAKNPEFWNYPAETGVADAINEAWPCPSVKGD